MKRFTEDSWPKSSEKEVVIYLQEGKCCCKSSGCTIACCFCGFKPLPLPLKVPKELSRKVPIQIWTTVAVSVNDMYKEFPDGCSCGDPCMQDCDPYKSKGENIDVVLLRYGPLMKHFGVQATFLKNQHIDCLKIPCCCCPNSLKRCVADSCCCPCNWCNEECEDCSHVCNCLCGCPLYALCSADVSSMAIRFNIEDEQTKKGSQAVPVDAKMERDIRAAMAVAAASKPQEMKKKKKKKKKNQISPEESAALAQAAAAANAAALAAASARAASAADVKAAESGSIKRTATSNKRAEEKKKADIEARAKEAKAAEEKAAALAAKVAELAAEAKRKEEAEDAAYVPGLFSFEDEEDEEDDEDI